MRIRYFVRFLLGAALRLQKMVSHYFSIRASALVFNN